MLEQSTVFLIYNLAFAVFVIVSELGGRFSRISLASIIFLSSIIIAIDVSSYNDYTVVRITALLAMLRLCLYRLGFQGGGNRSRGSE